MSKRSASIAAIVEEAEIAGLGWSDSDNTSVYVDGAIVMVRECGWAIQPTQDGWSKRNGELIEVHTRSELARELAHL